jgi:hypothetical protein
MDIYEKAGDFLVNTAQLVIGGVILANIMAQNINTLVVYVIGFSTIIAFLGCAYWFYRLSNNKKNK